jgi:hypothetical protein
MRYSSMIAISIATRSLIGLLLFYCINAIGAPSYCAFEVKVRKPSGVPFANVPVGIVEKGTQVATVVTDARGSAKFCDAPLQAVDIVVGTYCGGVLVKNVRPKWPTTRDIFVTYDGPYCAEVVFPDHCQVLLRVHDEEGRPVAGAHFDSVPSEREASDAFGRIFRLLKSGEKLEGILTKEGCVPARVSERCVRDNEHDVELNVVLRKRLR